MKKLHLIIFISTFLFFSCSLFEVKNPDVRSYFPLATGNYWEYEVREFGSSSPVTVRIEIGEKRIIAGKEFFRVMDLDYYIRAEEEFLLIYGPENEDTIIDTLFHHPNSLTGKEWYLKGAGWDPEEYLPYEADYEGKEVINLPSGSFDCLKVEYRSPPERNCANLYFIDDSDLAISSFWYGKNVGIVKIEEVWDYWNGEKDGQEWRLIKYNVKKK